MIQRSAFLSSNLVQRLLSAAVLAPLVLFLVWRGGWMFSLGMAIVCGFAVWEWVRLAAPRLSRKAWGWVWCVAGVCAAAFVIKGPAASLLLAFLSCPLTWFYARRQPEAVRKEWPSRALWAAAAVPFCAASGLALIHLRNNDEQGLVFIAYLIAIVWGTDTGAYIAGRGIGGPKLLPQISPKKTWAGLFGGMTMAGLLGYAVAYAYPLGLPPAYAAFVAVCLAVVGQAGDFTESYMKRRAGVKDSSHLIPGHGGVLDRVDGLFPVAISLALGF